MIYIDETLKRHLLAQTASTGIQYVGTEGAVWALRVPEKLENLGKITPNSAALT